MKNHHRKLLGLKQSTQRPAPWLSADIMLTEFRTEEQTKGQIHLPSLVRATRKLKQIIGTAIELTKKPRYQRVGVAQVDNNQDASVEFRRRKGGQRC